MKILEEKIHNIDWSIVSAGLNNKGFSIVSHLLSKEQCEQLINDYTKENLYRKTVVMERHRFGLGQYKYFTYPLPDMVQTIREVAYPNLVPVANLWMKALKIDATFPETLSELHTLCHQNNQIHPTPLILKYEKGGYNTLHQDLYGEVYFPFQIAVFLNEPDKEFTGGDFVMTEQVPRAQSKASVLRPKKGDMLIFTTNFRPVKGAKGYYRAKMKHGVSELGGGERHTLGVIFHDAMH